MKILLTILSLVGFLSAEMVEITADKFFADEKKQITEFTGSVVIIKGKDRLEADKIVVNFDSNRQPLKYTATGNASIDMIMEDKIYFGRANVMIYDPINNKYTLIKNAFLHEKVSNRKIYGDKIFVNQETGRYEVESDGKKPVKLIFKTEDKKR